MTDYLALAPQIDNLTRIIDGRVTKLLAAVEASDRDAIAKTLETLDRTELEALLVAIAARHTEATRTVDTDSERLAAIMREAARIFGTSPEDIAGPSRFREVVDARAASCYAARLFDMSYSRIGRQIGRDHSSVMAACGRVGETPRLRRAAERIAVGLGWSRGDGAA